MFYENLLTKKKNKDVNISSFHASKKIPISRDLDFEVFLERSNEGSENWDGQA